MIASPHRNSGPRSITAAIAHARGVAALRSDGVELQDKEGSNDIIAAGADFAIPDNLEDSELASVANRLWKHWIEGKCSRQTSDDIPEFLKMTRIGVPSPASGHILTLPAVMRLLHANRD